MTLLDREADGRCAGRKWASEEAEIHELLAIGNMAYTGDHPIETLWAAVDVGDSYFSVDNWYKDFFQDVEGLAPEWVLGFIDGAQEAYKDIERATQTKRPTTVALARLTT